MKALIQAFIKAQAEFKPIRKDGVNQFTKSGYCTRESLTEYIRPILAGHGLAYTQSVVVEDERLCVVTTIMHESGETMELGKLGFVADKVSVHGQAATITYALRYALVAAFALAPEGDDDDGNAALTNSGGRKAPAGRMKQEHATNHSNELYKGLESQIKGVEIPEDLKVVGQNIAACVKAGTITLDQRESLAQAFEQKRSSFNG